MSRRRSILQAVVAFMALTNLALAAEPHVVVAVRSAGEVVRDLQYLAKVIGGPIGAGLATRISQAAEESGLADVIAEDRPCGMYLSFAEEGGILAPVFYVPLRSAEALETFLKKRLHADIDEIADGIFRVFVGDDVAYVRLAEGYAFVSLTPGTLEELPEIDPLSPGRDFEIIVYASEIPDSVRAAVVDNCVAEMRARAAKIAQKHRDIAELVEYRVEVGERILREIAEQVETIRIAVWTDRDCDVVRGELSVTALPDTDLAAALSQTGTKFSRYASLADGALAFLHVAAPIPDACMELVGENIEITAKVSAEALRKRGVDVSPGLLAEALETFIVEGSVEYFIRVDLFDNQPHVAGAARVRSAEPIGELIKRYVAAGKVEAKEIGDFAGGKLFAVKGHVPGAKAVTVYLWTNNRELWGAVGEQAVDYLKKLIVTGQQAEVHETVPMTLVVDLKQVATALAKHDKRKHVAAAAKAALKAFGKEDASLRVRTAVSGRTLKITCETDAITLAGVAAAVVAHEAARRDVGRDKD